jgi:hypothetical protein
MSIKGKTVYMILYNYMEYDYSIIKLMDDLMDSYNYICHQESTWGVGSQIKLACPTTPYELDELQLLDYYHVLCVDYETYSKFNVCDYPSISSYLIVPMVID